MKRDQILCIGDKIDLHMFKGPYYRTTIDDIGDDDTLLVAVPIYRGIPIIVRIDQELALIFYRESGRYRINVRVKGFEMSGDVRLIRLQMLSEPEKEQRREFYRLPSSLETLLCKFPNRTAKRKKEAREVEEAAVSRNISVSGIALKTVNSYEIGEKLQLIIYLGWPDENSPPIEIDAEVKRVESVPANKSYEIGLQFTDISDEDSSLITKYILFEQKKRIKQQKLVEDD